MTRCATVARAVLLSMAGAGPAMAIDLLSGSYRPAREQVAPDAPAPLRVQAVGNGWVAWFEGQPQTMQPMGEAGLAKLFPGDAADGDIQCAATQALVLCRVALGGDEFRCARPIP